MFALVCFGYWGKQKLTQSHFFQLQQVVVETQDTLFKAQVYDFLKQKYVGFSLFFLSLENVEEALLNEFPLKNLYIKKFYPGTLKVSFQNKEAVALERQGGLWMAIDETGSRLKIIDSRSETSLPRLVGFSDSELKKSVCQLLKIYKNSKEMKGLSFENLEGVFWTQMRGLILSFEKPEIEVELGFKSFTQRLDRVQKSYDMILNRGLKSRVIDATYNNRVVVRVQSNLQKSHNRLNLK